jgi:hypothetical protein
LTLDARDLTLLPRWSMEKLTNENSISEIVAAMTKVNDRRRLLKTLSRNSRDSHSDTQPGTGVGLKS